MSVDQLTISKVTLQEFKYIEEIWNVQKDILNKFQNINIAFYRLDDDNDGYLLISDFCVNLVNKGFPPNVIQYERLFHFIDTDQDGKIDVKDWNSGFQRVSVKLTEVKDKISAMSRRIKENKVKLLEKFGLSPEKKGSSPPSMLQSRVETKSDRPRSKSPLQQYLESPGYVSIDEPEHALTDRLIKPQPLGSDFLSNPGTIRKEGFSTIGLDKSDKKELETVGMYIAEALKPKLEVNDSNEIRNLSQLAESQRSNRLVEFLKDQDSGMKPTKGNFTFNENSPESKGPAYSRNSNTDQKNYSESNSRSQSRGRGPSNDRDESKLESLAKTPDRSFSNHHERNDSADSFRTASEISILSAHKGLYDSQPKSPRQMSFGQLDMNKIKSPTENRNRSPELEPIPSDRNIEVVYKESDINLHIPNMNRAIQSANPSTRNSDMGNREMLPRSASKPLTSLPGSHPSTENNSPSRDPSQDKSIPESTPMRLIVTSQSHRTSPAPFTENRGEELQEIHESSQVISPRFSNTTEEARPSVSKPPLPSKFDEGKERKNTVDQAIVTEDIESKLQSQSQNSGSKEERTSEGREMNQPTYMSPPERLVNDEKPKSFLSSPQDGSQVSPVRNFDELNYIQQDTAATTNRNNGRLEFDENAHPSFSKYQSKSKDLSKRGDSAHNLKHSYLAETKQYSFGNAFNPLKYEAQTKSGKKKRSIDRENFLEEEPSKAEDRDLWSMFRKKETVKPINHYDQILNSFNQTTSRVTNQRKSLGGDKKLGDKILAASSLANTSVQSQAEGQKKQKDFYSGLMNSLSCMSLKIDNDNDEKQPELDVIAGEDSFSDSYSIDLKTTLKKDMKGDQRAYLLSELTRLDFVNRQLKKVNDSLYEQLTYH